MALITPSTESRHQILNIESSSGEERFSQAECHARVVGPLAGFEIERATACDVCYMRLAVPGREFQCRP